MANEKRLIDANELSLKIIATKFNLGSAQSDWQKGYIDGLMAAFCLIKDAPTVDAVEVVHGCWIERPLDNFRKYEVECSECGFTGIGNYDQYLEPCDFHYCPNCGAKMDGGNEDV